MPQKRNPYIHLIHGVYSEQAIVEMMLPTRKTTTWEKEDLLLLSYIFIIIIEI